MNLRNIALLAVALFCLAPQAALAHAHLIHAVPGVGATVKSAPDELQLTFTEAVETALSGVRVTTAAGAAVAILKPAGANAATLRVKLARPLSPGAYVVHWHAVAVDTHKTSGTYTFTVAP